MNHNIKISTDFLNVFLFPHKSKIDTKTIVISVFSKLKENITNLRKNA